MPNPSFKIIIKNITLIIAFVFGISHLLFAEGKTEASSGNRGYLYEDAGIDEVNKVAAESRPREIKAKAPAKKNIPLSDMQEQARLYRDQGLQLQEADNLDGALSLYQKAAEIDPGYAIVYNDLGIIYEAKGLVDRAEESYLKALKIDGHYLSAYSNLALLYENKHELDKAAACWQKRAEIGPANDPWTQRAKARLEDINLVLGKRPNVVTREQEILNFMHDVSVNLATIKKEKKKKLKEAKAVKLDKKIKQDNKDIAKDHYEQAKISYEKGDYVIALQEAMEAQQMDPSNKSVNTFIEELQRRLLSR